MQKLSFVNKPNPFFISLKEKVDGYFFDNQLSEAGNSKLYFKNIFIILVAVSLYVCLVFFTPPNWISVFLCIALGLNLALLGFNVMHEGGHQSLSKHSWMNTAGAYFLNVLGGNTHFWKIKHNLNHHTYTNIEGMDADIDIQPWMRLHENQPRYSLHRFQHIYWVFLYGISYLVWILWEDFGKYFTGKIAPGSSKKLDLREHFIFWFTKLMYLGVYLVLPIILVGWLKAVVGFILITFVCGLSISVVFQLAHIVEVTDFPTPSPESNKIENEWAVHQIKTTANFATHNKLVSWLLGGLNFQIEHHLFPKISHVHYPKISLLIKETCEEFSLDYLEYPTIGRAFRAHFLHIKRLGTI